MVDSVSTQSAVGTLVGTLEPQTPIFAELYCDSILPTERSRLPKCFPTLLPPADLRLTGRLGLGLAGGCEKGGYNKFNRHDLSGLQVPSRRLGAPQFSPTPGPADGPGAPQARVCYTGTFHGPG